MEHLMVANSLLTNLIGVHQSVMGTPADIVAASVRRRLRHTAADLPQLCL